MIRTWILLGFVLILAVTPLVSQEGEGPVGEILAVFHENNDKAAQLAALKKLRPLLLEGTLADEEKLQIAGICVPLMQAADDEIANGASDLMCWAGMETFPFVLNILKSDSPNGWARACSVISMMASREENVGKLDSAIPHLAKLLESHQKAAMNNAFYAISSLGLNAQPHLMKHMGGDDYYDRVMLKWFLKHGKDSVEPLCGKLRDGSLAKRRAALKILYHLSWETPELRPLLAEEGLELLIRSVAEEDSTVRHRAVDTLGRLGKEAAPALDALVAALGKPNPPLFAIATAILEIGPRKADVEAFLDATKNFERASMHPNDRFPVRQFGNLIAEADPSGVERLIPLIADANQRVSETALHALSRLGPTAAAAVPALIEKMEDEADRHGYMAVPVLAAIGPDAKQAIPHLIDYMGREVRFSPRYIIPRYQAEHRSSAADALVEMGTVAIPALLKGLESDAQMKRAGCLAGLAKMPDGEVGLNVFEALCGDKNTLIRELAFQEVAHRAKEGDSEALEILKGFAIEGEEEVSGAAEFHLNRLKAAAEDKESF